MQSVSSSIWTRVAVSISYDDNYYTTGTCLYLKMTEKCARLILQDGFRVEHIPLVRMVKFQFLAQFPMDHFPHPCTKPKSSKPN